MDTDELIEDIMVDQNLPEEEYQYQISSLSKPDEAANLKTFAYDIAGSAKAPKVRLRT